MFGFKKKKEEKYELPIMTWSDLCYKFDKPTSSELFRLGSFVFYKTGTIQVSNDWNRCIDWENPVSAFETRYAGISIDITTNRTPQQMYDFIRSLEND